MYYYNPYKDTKNYGLMTITTCIMVLLDNCDKVTMTTRGQMRIFIPAKIKAIKSLIRCIVEHFKHSKHEGLLNYWPPH
jgi:hypothetical protein